MNATARPPSSRPRTDLAPRDWSLSFQSRFGANRWLTPATNQTLRELPRRGVRSVSVICPGFAADCLETLEEVRWRIALPFLRPAVSASTMCRRSTSALIMPPPWQR